MVFVQTAAVRGCPGKYAFPLGQSCRSQGQDKRDKVYTILKSHVCLQLRHEKESSFSKADAMLSLSNGSTE
jgi:hypothetical protein